MELKKRSQEAAETPPLTEKWPISRKKSQESVIVYITILFTVVFLLILLSFMMHQQENEMAINELNEEHTESISDMQGRIDELEAALTEAREENQSLRERIKELEGESK